MKSLKEQFEDLVFNGYKINKEQAKQCIEIADGFAVGFKKFCDKQLSVRTDSEYLELYKQHLKDNGK